MNNQSASDDTRATRAARWSRFLLGGLINTDFSYGVYWLLARLLAYQLAYLLAYAAGIVFSYLFNAWIVFRTCPSWRSLVRYPGVYVVQYIVSAALLAALVELAGADTMWAPLAVTVAMVPLTYLLSRTALLGRSGHDRLRR